MPSNSIANSSSSLPISSSLVKKKRGNQSAKLKQRKLDARRAQWLSQEKNKGCKGEANGQGGTVDVGGAIVKLELKPRGEKDNEGFINNYISDTESTVNSPTSHSSSVLGSNDSGTNFTVSSSRSSSSSGHGCLGSISGEDEEGDDECLEDWEAIADALAATEEKQHTENDILDLPELGNKNASRMGCYKVSSQMLSGIDVSQLQKQESGVNVQRASVSNCCAWRPDDSFRPQSLPNLSKQYRFLMDIDRHFGLGGKSWNHNTASELTSCPICAEDFDVTDSSFLPCLCGYRLCLFCYKRILEDNDGRCPGCRKQYDCVPANEEATSNGGSSTIQLSRSCSMVNRS